MIDWKRKLSSRKFWALLGALIVSMLSIFGAGAETVQQITGTVAAVGACVMYMLAEAHADAGNKTGDVTADLEDVARMAANLIMNAEVPLAGTHGVTPDKGGGGGDGGH
jgi:hypothetical protein